MTGFSGLASSLLRNNRRLIAPKPQMSDIHLKKGVAKVHSKLEFKKLSEKELNKFKTDLSNKQKADNSKNYLLFTIVIFFIAAIMIWLYNYYS